MIVSTALNTLPFLELGLPRQGPRSQGTDVAVANSDTTALVSISVHESGPYLTPQLTSAKILGSFCIMATASVDGVE